MIKINNYLLLLAFFFSFSSLAQVDHRSKDDLYSLSKVHELRLEFPQKDWADDLDSLRTNGNDLLLGKIRIDGKKYDNIGVRYRGIRSFKTGNQRNSLNIKLNFKDKKQNHQGYKTLKLSNALRDPSMVREVLSFEIARKYMIAPRAAYTRIYVNNQYYGLFVNIESVNDDFLDKHFGSSNNTFVKCTPDLDAEYDKDCKQNLFSSLEFEDNIKCYPRNYELKSKSGMKELAQLTYILNKNPNKIGEVLDVDNVLWMHAFNNVLVNLSSYSGKQSQNYYLYKTDYGQFTPILWDLNLSFGSYKNTGKGSDLELKDLIALDPMLHEESSTKPLISQLLKNPQYRKIYIAHLRTILYDNFIDNSYEQRAKELRKMIHQAYNNDKFKTYTMADFERSLYSTVGKRSKIPGIYSLMSKRGKFLKKHPELTIIPPTIGSIEFEQRKQYSNIMVKDFKIRVRVENKASKVKIYYRYQESDVFTLLNLSDNGENYDANANDQIYSGVIDSKGNESIEYYVVAENARAIGFDPPNYMFQLHRTTLEELNKNN